MGRCQGKTIFNNIKSNMEVPKPNGSTTVKPEHLNVEKAEENDLQNNFIKALKEQMITALKK